MIYFVDKNQKNIFQNQAGDAPLRETGKISINFTPRYFPTPQRESLAPEEDAVGGLHSIIMLLFLEGTCMDIIFSHKSFFWASGP